MMFPDDDPFTPTAEEKQSALGLMAMPSSARCCSAVLAFDVLDYDISDAMQTIVAFALVVVVMGPRHVAYFVNVLRFLRNGWS